MRARLVIVPLAGLLAVSAAPAGHAAAACRNLPLDASVRPALTAAHARPREGAIAKGSVYYGQCGTTRYAIATFSKALGDQPEKFRKLAGKPWKDFGDGYEDGCAAGARYPVPAALVRLWHTCRSLG